MPFTPILVWKSEEEQYSLDCSVTQSQNKEKMIDNRRISFNLSPHSSFYIYFMSLRPGRDL